MPQYPKKYLDLLQLKDDFNEQEIRTAYRKKALKCHPDTGGTKEQFQELNQAYKYLINQYQNSIQPQENSSFFSQKKSQRKNSLGVEQAIAKLYTDIENTKVFMNNSRKETLFHKRFSTAFFNIQEYLRAHIQFILDESIDQTDHNKYVDQLAQFVTPIEEDINLVKKDTKPMSILEIAACLLLFLFNFVLMGVLTSSGLTQIIVAYLLFIAVFSFVCHRASINAIKDCNAQHEKIQEIITDVRLLIAALNEPSKNSEKLLKRA